LPSSRRLDFDFDTANLSIVRRNVEANIKNSVRNRNRVFLKVGNILATTENKEIKHTRLNHSTLEKNLKQTRTRAGIIRRTIAATNAHRAR
jgi:hypothetical protein